MIPTQNIASPTFWLKPQPNRFSFLLQAPLFLRTVVAIQYRLGIASYPVVCELHFLEIQFHIYLVQLTHSVNEGKNWFCAYSLAFQYVTYCGVAGTSTHRINSAGDYI